MDIEALAAGLFCFDFEATDLISGSGACFVAALLHCAIAMYSAQNWFCFADVFCLADHCRNSVCVALTVATSPLGSEASSFASHE